MNLIIKFSRNLLPILLTVIIISCNSDDPLTVDGDTTTNNPTDDESSFVSVWSVSDANKTIVLPIYDGTGTSYDFTVDWGDGTIASVTSYDDPDRSHTYAAAGEKTVTIIGKLIGFNFFIVKDSNELIESITSWGDIHFGFETGIFWQCKALTTLPDESPDLTGITSISYYFSECDLFTGNVKNWDVSNIVNFDKAFYKALKFNEDISGWDVSKATTVDSMFAYTEAFNQDISSWDVTSITDFYGMFSKAKVFNQDISTWDVSNAYSLGAMFSGAEAFNQDISSWDVSNISKMSSMFSNNKSFNQDLSGWDTNNVTNCLHFVRYSTLEMAYLPTLGSCFSTTNFTY
ncbi:BspA family leucine-rich repeat surface protein [Flavivirga jejuensis]|uniref:BspA family leucine-rich repeat surface protein n=1 Tax=Flavivirga jejuensis TaxID=870487 RepID=A0ABT8WSE3_9FLAO|nr:BspA family leucine-rich repeat surface protein [Flavivirga jejuensis]MDO5976100.1 BspA family leucine-rich repeat surface protein [Flavivirga jejuensis]